MKSVLLLFGGESSEHEVSIASAKNVFGAIDKTEYDVSLGYIDKVGHWWLVDDFEDLTGSQNELLPVLGGGWFKLSDDSDLKVDVILPILHGEHGEDGTVQGLAELLHIPMVGSGVEASVVSIDKELTKRVAEHAGVNIVPYIGYRRGEETPAWQQVTEKLGSTVFVKPSRLGSSVGVSKVDNEIDFQTALIEAAKLDDKVLIEQAIVGREIEVSVLGNVTDFAVSEPGEVVPDREFYSYESKYDPDSQSKVMTPADLPKDKAEEIKALTRTVFKAVEGKGLARIDFFLTPEGKVYFGEVNTMPGFTNISMYPKSWQAAGISYSDLISRLIELA